MKKSQPEKRERSPITGWLQPDAPKDADYLQTLHEWQRLPKVLALPDAATFLGAQLKQNPAALLLILGDAVWEGELRYWGLSDQGGWREGMMRSFVRTEDIPEGAIERDDAGDIVAVRTELLPQKFERSSLHSEAMGVAPVDAVLLLKRLGRKVPANLLSLLPEIDPTAATQVVGSPRVYWRKVLKDRLASIDAGQQNRRANVTQVIRAMKALSDPRILSKGGPAVLHWLDEYGSEHVAQSKGVSNFLSELRSGKA